MHPKGKLSALRLELIKIQCQNRLIEVFAMDMTRIFPCILYMTFVWELSLRILIPYIDTPYE